MDGNGKVHVAFALVGTEAYVGPIYYVTNTSDNWVTTRLTSEHAAAGVPSLAADANGKVHVAFGRSFWSTNPGLYYVTNRSGSWVTARLTSSVDNRVPALVADGSDKVYLAFARPCWSTGTGLYYVTNRSGSWVTTRLRHGHRRDPVARRRRQR